MAGKLGIYIHIPFCKSKCYYCDFNSSADSFENESRYMEYLKREIELYRREIEKLGIKTIFFGGGTPTVVSSKAIRGVLETLYEINGSRDIEEVTIEGNPSTFTEEKLRDYTAAGIDRVSLGVQSLDDTLLKEIGRVHSASDVYETVKLLREYKFSNINLDIMFGLPNQSYSDVEDTIMKVLELGVEHISYYGLKLEEGTVLYKREADGDLALPDEDEERKMYHEIISLLKSNGYSQYEISNFSKEGHECIHNLGYWKLRPYIGLGLSAASNIEKMRYSNVESFTDYFKAVDSGEKPIAIETVEEIDGEMEMAEYMILGLRLNEGVRLSDFKDRFGFEVDELYGETVEKYIERGLLERGNDRLKLSGKGQDLSNQLFAELLP